MASSDNPAHSYFASLLEQSRKLREDTEAADLPPIQLGLGEIERRAKELKKARPGARSDTRAHYLLAAGGVNADEALRNLDAIDAQTSYEPSPALVDTDLESYLKSRKEQNIMTSIEDGMQRTSRDFDSYVAKNVTMEWDQEKARIFEHFGLYPKSEEGTAGFGNSTFGASQFGRTVQGSNLGKSTYGTGSVWATTMGSSILGKPQQAASGNFFPDVDSTRQLSESRPVVIRRKEYAKVVKRLNEVRLQSAPFPVIRQFEEVTAASGNDVLTLQLSDSWKILENITKESADGSPFSDGAGERHYAKLHINVKPDSQEATQLKKLIESGSRRYLENVFFRHVEETITKNKEQARLGGVPSVANKFRAYFTCKVYATPSWNDKHFDLNPDNVPVWALVFYMVRGGYVQEAAAYVKENHQFFQKLDRSFHQYIAAYAKDPDRRIPRSLGDRIQVEHTQLLRDAENVDMFRIALYKIIGRCDLAKRSLTDVLPTAEDWMWLQLVLTRETERVGEPAHEVFQLGDLQKSVLQFGAKHFSSKGSNVGLYFQMLLMSGLFEHAIQYLYSFQQIDAVHFAIALTYYGLLGVASTTAQKPDSNLLVNGPLGDYQINFARMIGQYIRQHRLPTIEDSVDYLCLICLNGDLPAPDGPTQLSLCHEALRQISLESKEIKTLLGNVTVRGERTKGVIYKRMKLVKIADHNEFLRTILQQAAVQADDEGRVQDAVLLYDLAEDYDTVVQVLNKCISDWVSSEDYAQLASTLASQSDDHIQKDSISITEIVDPPELGRTMLENYMGAVAMYRQITPRNREALTVLLKIAEAKKMFLREDFEGCLSQIEKLDVIPMEPRVEVGFIRQTAQNFGSLHDAVARNVGMLLKLAVECCYKLATILKETVCMDTLKRQKIDEYRARVKSAMIYAGMVQYKLPSNVYEFIAHRDEAM